MNYEKIILVIIFTISLASAQTTITQTQTVTVDGSGSPTSIFIAGSRTYDCGQIPAGVDSSFIINVTGAIIGNPCTVGTDTIPEQGLAVNAWCDSVNVIKVVLSNRTNNFLNPSSKIYKVSQRIL